MIKTDYHLHTEYSFDSTEKMEDIVRRAIELGLSEIIFTDHLETLDPNVGINEIIDYDKYVNELEDLKEKYGKSIDLKLGAEINLEPEIITDINSYLDKYPFDFVIGSLHATNFEDFAMSDFSKGKTKDEYYNAYFQWGIDCVKQDFKFCVLGHIDYIVRYGGFSDKYLDMSIHKDAISEILKILIGSGKGIEINTAGLRYNLGHVHPKVEILKLYKELGGEIITVGSDAHRKADLAKDFDIAKKLLKDCGFKHYTRFEKMKPIFEKI